MIFGMDTTVVDPNIDTPYLIGTKSGNFSD